MITHTGVQDPRATMTMMMVAFMALVVVASLAAGEHANGATEFDGCTSEKSGDTTSSLWDARCHADEKPSLSIFARMMRAADDAEAAFMYLDGTMHSLMVKDTICALVQNISYVVVKGFVLLLHLNVLFRLVGWSFTNLLPSLCEENGR
jgi:hypothetical protein